MEFAAANCSTYEKFTTAKWDLYKEMMALMKYAHQWALVAAAILEERMERMSCYTSQWCSSSCWHSSSHWCRRSRSSGCWKGDPQVTYHQREPEARVQVPQVTSHHRGTIWGWTQPPSPTRQKCCVTFAKGRAPSLTDERSECDARVDVAHQLPPLTWQTEEVPFKEADWLMPRGEAGTILAEGDEDLESPPPLKPHLEQLLGIEELSPVGTKVGDGLPPPPTSTPEDPEPSPLCQLAWIQWHARHVEMPPWWRELIKIPSHEVYQEFAWKVHASFEVPNVHNWAKRVDNDHPPHQHTLQLENTTSSQLPMWCLALRTTDLPNPTIPLPMWGCYSIVLRRPNHQSLANLAVWQKA